MKKFIILLAFLLSVTINTSYAQNGLSFSMVLGAGNSNVPTEDYNLPDDLDDTTDTRFYEPSELESKGQWANTALAAQFRNGKNAFEVESFAAEVEVNYTEYEDNDTSADGIVTYSFSGLAFSYIYYPKPFKGEGTLQPFVKFGRANYTYTTTDAGNSETTELVASGRVLGAGVEFFMNDHFSIVAGTRYYTTHLGEDYNFVDFGVRVSF